MTVMVGCPVQNRAEILPAYLECIHNLNYSRSDIHLAFFINHSDDNSYDILNAFRQNHISEYDSIDLLESSGDGYRDNRRDRDYSYFANVRNTWLSMRNPTDEYIFSVDSDILISSYTLKQLLSHHKLVTSALVLNGVNSGFKFFNVMNRGNNCYVHIDEAQFEPLMPVDVTGACYLIETKALDGGFVYYADNIQGEDIPFCEKVRERFGDGNIFCDTTLHADHKKL